MRSAFSQSVEAFLIYLTWSESINVYKGKVTRQCLYRRIASQSLQAIHYCLMQHHSSFYSFQFFEANDNVHLIYWHLNLRKWRKCLRLEHNLEWNNMKHGLVLKLLPKEDKYQYFITYFTSWQDEEDKIIKQAVISCHVIVLWLNTVLTTQWFNITLNNLAHQWRCAAHWQNLNASIWALAVFCCQFFTSAKEVSNSQVILLTGRYYSRLSCYFVLYSSDNPLSYNSIHKKMDQTHSEATIQGSMGLCF